MTIDRLCGARPAAYRERTLNNIKKGDFDA